MSGLLDFISNSFPSEIVSSETIKLVPNGIISHGKRVQVNIQRNIKENCKTIYSEPVLCLKLNENSKQITNFYKIIDNIELQIGGVRIDRIFYSQININQHKYNIMPKQYGNMVLIPLPFNCLLKNNGIPFNTPEYYDHTIRIDLSSCEESKNIIDGCLYLNYTFINQDIDLTNLTELNYAEMSKTKFNEKKMLKINNKMPSDFLSYYFINSLLSLTHTQKQTQKPNQTHMPNITQEMATNNANANLTQEMVTNANANANAKSFNVPINLLKISQTQFTGEESIFSKCQNGRFRLNFYHDVTSMYVQLNISMNKKKSGEIYDIYEEKWFDLLCIQVNGHDTIEYTYEMLCLNKDKSNYNLPKGVFEIPNVKYIDWNADSIVLTLSNINMPENVVDSTVAFCVDSDNYLVCGTNTKLMFTN